jgi:hypothetical protein
VCCLPRKVNVALPSVLSRRPWSRMRPPWRAGPWYVLACIVPHMNDHAAIPFLIEFANKIHRSKCITHRCHTNTVVGLYLMVKTTVLVWHLWVMHFERWILLANSIRNGIAAWSFIWGTLHAKTYQGPTLGSSIQGGLMLDQRRRDNTNGWRATFSFLGTVTKSKTYNSPNILYSLQYVNDKTFHAWEYFIKMIRNLEFS